MPKETGTITIESILGGQSELRYFSRKDQFQSSYAIDPDQPAADSGSQSYGASGYLRPTSSQRIDYTLAGSPMWMVSNPKNGNVYVYDSGGSVHTLDPDGYSMTGLSDLNDGMTASGNGAAYYDNYVYFATDTTIARYGPLNGTAAFTDNYWVSSLSMSALSNTTYPSLVQATKALPNHVLHLHVSNGRLYIADVVGNQGTLHYIATTATSAEGDTNNSSTYNALDLPYGFWPTDIESYGTDLAIACYEGNNETVTLQKKAKLYFWDTTSTSQNKVIEREFPDPIITALENVNGVLWVFSGQLGVLGTRVSKFVGGYSFEQVAFIDDSEPPFPGATAHILNRVMFGGTAASVNDGTKLPGVWAIGSKTGKFSGLYNIMGATNSSSSTDITSLGVIDQDGFNFQIPVIGWTTGSAYGVDRQTSTYDKVNQIWRSATYRIGRPFKITKVRFPLAQAMAANMIVVPKIYVDEQATSYTLTTLNNTNYANSQRTITQRLENTTGEHSFFLELKWSGSALCTLAVPITIEYEILND